MIEAVTINEIKKMARPDTLQQQKEILGKRIDGSVGFSFAAHACCDCDRYRCFSATTCFSITTNG